MSERFVMLPARVLDDDSLGAAAWRILAAIADTSRGRNGWSAASMTIIGDRIGVSKQAVQKQLAVLESKGYVEVERARRNDGAPSHRYRVLYDSKVEESSEAGQPQVVEPVNQGLPPGQPQVVEPVNLQVDLSPYIETDITTTPNGVVDADPLAHRGASRKPTGHPAVQAFVDEATRSGYPRAAKTMLGKVAGNVKRAAEAGVPEALIVRAAEECARRRNFGAFSNLLADFESGALGRGGVRSGWGAKVQENIRDLADWAKGAEDEPERVGPGVVVPFGGLPGRAAGS